MPTPPRPRVAVLGTGGTIAECLDPATGAVVPTLSIAELIAAIPELADIADVRVEQLMNIDSSQAHPEDWLRLAHRLNATLAEPDIAGAVVTHGTDTMEEGVFFIDRLLDSEKPVCFVGAQRSASDPRSDGPPNIRDAVAVAASPEARGLGAVVVMNSYIAQARGVRKTQTFNVQTFQPDEGGYLGYVAFGRVRIYHRPDRPPPVPMPPGDTLPRVDVIPMYPGCDGRLLRHAVATGADGIVIEGVGAGNVNHALYEAIAVDAKARGVPVVVTSRVYYGRVFPLYGGPGGGRSLADAGCILAGELTTPQARVQLILGLTMSRELSELRLCFE
jgi:L-asparaginase